MAAKESSTRSGAGCDFVESPAVLKAQQEYLRAQQKQNTAPRTEACAPTSVYSVQGSRDDAQPLVTSIVCCCRINDVLRNVSNRPLSAHLNKWRRGRKTESDGYNRFSSARWQCPTWLRKCFRLSRSSKILLAFVKGPLHPKCQQQQGSSTHCRIAARFGQLQQLAEVTNRN